MCWIKEGCKTLAPKSCSRLPLDVVDHVEGFDSYNVNLHLNRGCLAREKTLDPQLNNAPASCNPPCFRIKQPGEYCYMGTRNNNFSNRRHIGQITVIKPEEWLNIACCSWSFGTLLNGVGFFRCWAFYGKIKRGTKGIQAVYLASNGCISFSLKCCHFQTVILKLLKIKWESKEYVYLYLISTVFEEYH